MSQFSLPPGVACLSDYERYAHSEMDEKTWAYVYGASADEITASRNTQVFSEIKLLNRVLAEVSHGSTAINLLGEALAHPIITAPVAYQKLAHEDGELGTAMAAAAQDGLFVLSTLASTSIEDIAANSDGKRWFQLYFQHSREQTLALVRKAEEHGFTAIMVTVDAPVNGLRNREQRAGFALPANIRAVNCQQQNMQVASGESGVFQGLMSVAPTWQDMKWLRQQTSLPVVIKGIMHPADARRALECGANGIVVSNHGGRTLDTLPATAEVLPLIREAVGEMFPIILDSGVRRGTDIVKAIALGANAVMIGRPIMYGLASAGAMGVAHTIRLLRDELELAMALTGFSSVDQIDRTCLWKG